MENQANTSLQNAVNSNQRQTSVIPSDGFNFIPIEDMFEGPETQLAEVLATDPGAIANVSAYKADIDKFGIPAMASLGVARPSLATGTFDPVAQQNPPQDAYNIVSQILKAESKGPAADVVDKRFANIRQSNFMRYYEHPDFAQLGFTPYADMESYYNANSTIYDDMSRMRGQFGSLVGSGFSSVYRSIGDMFDDDSYFSAPDIDSAMEFEDAMAIGNSSRGGALAFTNNMLLNSGYTFGIIGSIAVEELILAGATYLSGGATSGLAAVRTAQNLARIGKGAKNFFNISKMQASTRALLNQLKNYDAAKSFWQAAKSGGKVVGNILTPQTYSALKNFKTAKNATQNANNLAKAKAGFGGFYRDFRSVNLALAESKLEGGMVYNELVREGVTIQKKKTGNVTPEQMALIQNKAGEGAFYTTMTNAPLIFLSNQIVLGNAMGGFNRSLGRVFNDTFKKGLNGRMFKGKGVKDAVTGKITDVFEDAGSGLKGWWTKVKAGGVKGNAGMAISATARYFAANVAEGLQEIGQEAIAVGTKGYYTTVMEDPLAGGIELQNDMILSGMSSQFSGQGAETFLSGFLMGGIVQGPQKLVFQGMPALYNRISDPKAYKEYQETKKEYVDNLVKVHNEAWNSTVNDPSALFDPTKLNFLVQKQVAGAMKENAFAQDRFGFTDEKDFGKFQQLYTIFQNGTSNYFRTQLTDFMQMTDEELGQAFPDQKKEIKNGKARQRLEKLVTNLDKFEASFENNKDKFTNPYDRSQYDKGSRQYILEAIKEKAFEHSTYLYMFTQDGFKRATERANSIYTNLSNDPLFEKMAANDITVLLDIDSINNEMGLLLQDIAVQDKETSEGKKAIEKATNKIKNLSAIEKILTDPKNLTKNGSFDRRKINKLTSAFEKYVQFMANSTNSFVDRSKMKDALNDMVDYHALKGRAKVYDKAIEYLNNPQRLNEIVDRQIEVNKNIYKNLTKIHKQQIEKYINIQEANTLMNKLFEAGYVGDPEQVKKFLISGNVNELKNFYDEQGDISPQLDKVKYDQIQRLLDAYRSMSEKSEDISETTEEKSKDVEVQETKSNQDEILEEANIDVVLPDANSSILLQKLLDRQYRKYSATQTVLDETVKTFEEWRNTEGLNWQNSFNALKKLWVSGKLPILDAKGNPIFTELSDADIKAEAGFDQWLRSREVLENPLVRDILQAAGIPLNEMYYTEPVKSDPTLTTPKVTNEDDEDKIDPANPPKPKVFQPGTTADVLRIITFNAQGEVEAFFKLIDKKGNNISEQLLLQIGITRNAFNDSGTAIRAMRELDKRAPNSTPFPFDDVMLFQGQLVYDSDGKEYRVISTPKFVQGGNLRLVPNNFEGKPVTLQAGQFKNSYTTQEIKFDLLPSNVARVNITDINKIYPHANTDKNGKRDYNGADDRLNIILDNLTQEEISNLELVISVNNDGGKNIGQYVIKGKEQNPNVTMVQSKYSIGLSIPNGKTRSRINKILNDNKIPISDNADGVFAYIPNGNIQIKDVTSLPNISREQALNSIFVSPELKATLDQKQTLELVRNNFAINSLLLAYADANPESVIAINQLPFGLNFITQKGGRSIDNSTTRSLKDLRYEHADENGNYFIFDLKRKKGSRTIEYITTAEENVELYNKIKSRLEKDLMWDGIVTGTDRYIAIVQLPDGSYRPVNLKARPLTKDQRGSLAVDLVAQAQKTKKENLDKKGKVKDEAYNRDFNDNIIPEKVFISNNSNYNISLQVSPWGELQLQLYDKINKKQVGETISIAVPAADETTFVNQSSATGLMQSLIKDYNDNAEIKATKVTLSNNSFRESFPTATPANEIIDLTTTNVRPEVVLNSSARATAESSIIQAEIDKGNIKEDVVKDVEVKESNFTSEEAEFSLLDLSDSAFAEFASKDFLTLPSEFINHIANKIIKEGVDNLTPREVEVYNMRAATINVMVSKRGGEGSTQQTSKGEGKTASTNPNQKFEDAVTSIEKEIQALRDPVTGEISGENFAQFKKLQADLVAAQLRSRRGFSTVAIGTVTRSGEYLMGEEKAAEDKQIEDYIKLIEKGVKSGKITVEKGLQMINLRAGKNYAFLQNEQDLINGYIRDRLDSTLPEIGNNKSSWQMFRDGKQPTKQTSDVKTEVKRGLRTKLVALYEAISKRNRNNNEALSDMEWNQGFNEAAAAGGNELMAHGMGKSTLAGGLADLLNLMDNGIDPNKGRGSLDVINFVAEPGTSGGATTGGAYRGGPFMLIAAPGHVGGITNMNQVAGLLVNKSMLETSPGSGVYSNELLEALRESFPNLIIEDYSNAGSLTKQIMEKKAATKQTSNLENIKQELDVLKTQLLENVAPKDRGKTLRTNEEYQKLLAKRKAIEKEANKIMSSSDLSLSDVEDIDVFTDWAANNLPGYMNISDITTLGNNLKAGGVRVGAFVLGLNHVAGGQKVSGTIYTGALSPYKYHEAFHGVFRMLLSDEEIKRYRNIARKEVRAKLRAEGKTFEKELQKFKNSADTYSSMTRKELENEYYEEYLADEFNKFKINPKSTNTDSGVKSLFTRIIEWIQAVFNSYSKNELRTLFENIDAGKFKGAQIANNEFTTALDVGATIEANALIPHNSITEKGNLGFVYLDSDIADPLVRNISAMFLQRISGLTESYSPAVQMDSILDDFQWLYSVDNPINENKTDLQKIKLNEIESAFDNYTDEIRKQSITYINQISDKSNNEEFEVEEFEDSTGLRTTSEYEKDASMIGGFRSLSSQLRAYIATTSVKATDYFGNIELKDGEPLIIAVNFVEAYNGLLKAVKNLSDPRQILQSMYFFGQDNSETGAVVQRILNDVGITEEQLLKDNGIPTEIQSPLLFQSILKGFENFRIDYLFNERDNAGNTIVYSASERDDVNSQLDRWNQGFISKRKQLIIDPKRKNLLIDLLAKIQRDILPTDKAITSAKLKKDSKKYSQELFDFSGIKISPLFFQYSMLYNRTNLQEEQSVFLKINANETAALTHDLDGKAYKESSIALMSQLIQTNDDIFSVGEDGMDSRLKNMSIANAPFDETIGASVFKNPNGDLIYAHQLPTYHLKKIAQLNSSEALIDLLESDPYLANNYLLNNDAFKQLSLESRLQVIRVAGNKIGDLISTEEELGDGLQGDKQTSTYGDFTPQEFALNLINNYGALLNSKSYKVSRVESLDKEGDKIISALAPVLIRVMEASNTGDMISLPVIKTVEMVNGEAVLTEETVDIYIDKIRTEFARINREANDATKTQEDILGYTDGRALTFFNTKTLMSEEQQTFLINAAIKAGKAGNIITLDDALAGTVTVAEQTIDDDLAIERAREIEELQAKKETLESNPEYIILSNIPKITPTSAKKETGGKVGVDQDINPSWLDRKGVSVEKAAENIFANNFAESEEYSEAEIRDFIIDILSKSKAEANREIFDERRLAELLEYKQSAQQTSEVESLSNEQIFQEVPMVELMSALSSRSQQEKLKNNDRDTIENAYNQAKAYRALKENESLKEKIQDLRPQLKGTIETKTGSVVVITNDENVSDYKARVINREDSSGGTLLTVEVKKGKQYKIRVDKSGNTSTGYIEDFVFKGNAAKEAQLKDQIENLKGQVKEGNDSSDFYIDYFLNKPTQQTSEVTNEVSGMTALRDNVVDNLESRFQVFEQLIDELKIEDQISNQVKAGPIVAAGVNRGALVQSASLLNLNDNYKHNLKQIFFNDAINSYSINEILLGDQAVSLKDSVDQIKRAKMQNGAYYSAYSAITAPQHGVVHPVEDISLVTLTEPQDNGIDIADAQMYITTKAFRYMWFGFGKLSAAQAEFINRIEAGQTITSDSVFGNKVTPEGYAKMQALLNSKKLVYGDGSTFLKMSAFTLTPEYTSVWNDDIKSWVAQPGKETLHNLRLKLEAIEKEKETIAIAAPLSAVKMKKQRVNSLEELDNTDPFTNGVTTLDARFMGLQQLNPSNKLEQVDPTQIKQILTSEQNDDQFVPALDMTVGQIRTEYNKAISERVTLKFKGKRNLIFTFDGAMDELNISQTSGKITPKLAAFLQYALSGLKASQSSSQILEFFSMTDGVPNYNLNNQITVRKFEQLFLSYFSKGVFSERTPGLGLTLVSDFGNKVYRRVFEIKDGVPIRSEIIRRAAWQGNENNLLNIDSLTQDNIGPEGVVVLDRLRHGVMEHDSNGEPTGQRYTEMMMPAHHKSVMDFIENTPSATMPETISKMFGVRIPSQDNHSAMNIKWVDFMPVFYGSSAMFARELVKVSGADFDIDKVFAQFKDFYVKDGEFFEYGNKNTIEENYSDYIRYVNANVNKSGTIYSEAYLTYDKNLDAATIDNSTTDAEEKAYYESLTKENIVTDAGLKEAGLKALQMLGLPITKAQYSEYVAKYGEPYAAPLNNKILDYKYALLGNDSVASGENPISYSPAALDILESTLAELAEDSFIFKNRMLEENNDVDDLVGKILAFKANKGASIGAAVLPNLYLSLLTEYGIDLKTPIIIDGLTYDSFKYTTEKKNEGDQRKQDTISSLITMATDNAKERLFSKLGLNRHALGLVSMMTSLSIPIRTSILLINNPVIQDLYSQALNKKDKFDPGIQKLVSNRINNITNSLKQEGVMIMARQVTDTLLLDTINFPSEVTDMEELNILSKFAEFIRLNEFTDKMSAPTSLTKGLGKDMTTVLDKKEKIKDLLDVDAPLNLNKIYNSNTWYSTYLKLFKQLTDDLLPATFLSSAPVFQDILNNVVDNIDTREVKTEDVQNIALDLLSYLNIKGYQYNLLQNGTLNEKVLSNDLIYPNSDRSIVDVINEIKEVLESKGESNFFIDNFVIPESATDVGNDSGLNIAMANTFRNLSAPQKVDLQNSFAQLYGSLDTKNQAQTIINYMMVKDGLQLRYGSLLEAIAPFTINKFLSHIDTVEQAVRGDVSFESAFGLSKEELTKEFTEGFLESNINGSKLWTFERSITTGSLKPGVQVKNNEVTVNWKAIGLSKDVIPNYVRIVDVQGVIKTYKLDSESKTYKEIDPFGSNQQTHIGFMFGPRPTYKEVRAFVYAKNGKQPQDPSDFTPLVDDAYAIQEEILKADNVNIEATENSIQVQLDPEADMTNLANTALLLEQLGLNQDAQDQSELEANVIDNVDTSLPEIDEVESQLTFDFEMELEEQFPMLTDFWDANIQGNKEAMTSMRENNILSLDDFIEEYNNGIYENEESFIDQIKKCNL